MGRYLAILAAATLMACSGSDDETTDKVAGDDDDTLPGDDDDDTCGTNVLTQFPVDGETGAYFKSDVRFQLSAPDTTATITVTETGGGEISGSTSAVGNLVVWEGDDFAPNSEYTATLTYACGEATSSFTTSATGPAAGPGIVNTTYNLDIASGSWILPSPEIGGLLSGFLDVALLFMPLSADTEIVMLGALGTETGEQDVCTVTFEFPPAAFEDPFFQIASPLLTLTVADLSIDIEDLDLQGSFTPDASGIEGASLKGVIDTRPLVDLLVKGGEDTAVCELVATFGVSCTDCGGGEEFCLEVWVDNITAEATSNPPLVVVTEEDVAANGTCL